MDIYSVGTELRKLVTAVLDKRDETSDGWTAEEIKYLDDTQNGRVGGK